ncbi:hypothetical protein AVEN_106382-1 [Araneus ventricosus]|uniref:Uncharacterized protein n=1 Tax=Araneus ventricosus TaxID=182803 RepID=A0A4Y2AVE0_ARAVE|nr:hypothetical protein AVEN_106382-1 [Araneus ventricosus]
MCRKDNACARQSRQWQVLVLTGQLHVIVRQYRPRENPTLLTFDSRHSQQTFKPSLAGYFKLNIHLLGITFKGRLRLNALFLLKPVVRDEVPNSDTDPINQMQGK